MKTKMKTKAPKKAVKSVKKIQSVVIPFHSSKKQTGFLKITVNHSKFKIQDIKFSVNKLSLEMIIEIWEQLGGFLERQIEEIAEEEGLKKKTTKKKTNTKNK